MIYFETETIVGDLILIKSNRPQLPPCPVLAKRATKPQPILITVALWIISFFAPLATILQTACDHWPPTLPQATKQKWAVLIFLAEVVAAVIVENLAQSYIGLMIG